MTRREAIADGARALVTQRVTRRRDEHLAELETCERELAQLDQQRAALTQRIILLRGAVGAMNDLLTDERTVPGPGA